MNDEYLAVKELVLRGLDAGDRVAAGDHAYNERKVPPR
jgi:hypothetical protein